MFTANDFKQAYPFLTDHLAALLASDEASRWRFFLATVIATNLQEQQISTKERKALTTAAESLLETVRNKAIAKLN